MEKEPYITVGPLKISILGRQFPDIQDYWDGNWLDVIACCEGDGSRVEVRGPFIHLDELKRWKDELESFRRTLTGSVELQTIEPELNVIFQGPATATGQFSCEIS